MYNRFEGAVKQLRLNPPHLIEGDGVALISKAIKDVPVDTTICIFHIHVANQMPKKLKAN